MQWTKESTGSLLSRNVTRTLKADFNYSRCKFNSAEHHSSTRTQTRQPPQVFKIFISQMSLSFETAIIVFSA
jgi:hypothetical protein